MGSHSVTCHPTEARIPPLPLGEAGIRFSDPGGMQSWVDLRYVKTTGLELNPRPVNRKSNALPLSHHSTQGHGHESQKLPALVLTSWHSSECWFLELSSSWPLSTNCAVPLAWFHPPLCMDASCYHEILGRGGHGKRNQHILEVLWIQIWGNFSRL